MDEVEDAWKRYAEACCEHDEREGRLALSHLVPAQRTEAAERGTVSERAARSA